MKQEIIPSGRGQGYDWSKDHIIVKTPEYLTGGRVTLVEDTLKPGFHLPRHYHQKMTEVFYILEGEVEFKFDDETILTRAGMTLNIPPNNWHEVRCPQGARLLTLFTPGGFDLYLAELARLSDAEFADSSLMTALAEKYDTWMR
ncbi:MAG: cupin domain-containing protein [Chloroflexi bacterium]|nr:cupin domain-containing protein [Chloroflexota bacterium]